MARGQNEYRSYSSSSSRRGASSRKSSSRRTDAFEPGSYEAVYTPNSQGRAANKAFANQNGSGQYSRDNSQYSSKRKKKMSVGKKVAIVAVALVVLVGAGAGVAYGLYVDTMNKVNAQLKGDKSDEEMKAIEAVLAPPQTYDKPFYMMLVGSDARADDAEMGQRSDTNILVRVDAINATVTLVSIPRDTMIDIDGYGSQKFNAAYAYGGIASTIQEASQLCGVDISHWAEVDFNALIQLVDVVGGVDVEVEQRIDDPAAGPVVIEVGTQHLDGQGALTFARSRQYVDGDFTRTANQRKIIQALVVKMLQMPVTDLPGLVEQAAGCVTTDMSAEDILSMALQFKNRDGQDVKETTIYSAMVPSGTAMIDGISYVIADTAALAEMMKIVDAGGDPSTVVSSGYVEVPGGSSNDYYYDDTYYDNSYSDSGGYDDSGGYTEEQNTDDTYYEDGSGGYSEDAAA